MDLQIPLPIRLATSASFEETTATPETPKAPETRSGADQAAASRPAPNPDQPLSNALSPRSYTAEDRAAENASYGLMPLSPGLRVRATPGPSNHQFWLKDAKVAEELFTIHRSAQDLVNFVCKGKKLPTSHFQDVPKSASHALTSQHHLSNLNSRASSIIGTQDPSSGHRPIPVMSDGDVLFMTQLSEDIVRSVNGITSIRQHGTRMRRRKIKHGHPAPPPAPPPQPSREYSTHRSRASRDDTVAAVRTSRESMAASGGASRRLRKPIEDDQLQLCYKCGRKETPEWRKGPDGLLCNSCGLVYAKQRRKQKMAERAEKGDKAGL